MNLPMYRRFNPCYNGSGWLRPKGFTNSAITTGFNPCYNGSGWLSKLLKPEPQKEKFSFNPCYNGSGWLRANAEVLL